MMDVLEGWRVELIGQGLIGRRTTGPNARVAATAPLSDWRSTIYDRSDHACVANLTDHANLQKPSNEERVQLIKATAISPGIYPEKRNNRRNSILRDWCTYRKHWYLSSSEITVCYGFQQCFLVTYQIMLANALAKLNSAELWYQCYAHP